MKTRRILIVALSALLTICMSIPTNANILSSSKVMETIDAQLQAILQDATSTERVPVDIWLYETSTKQEREQKIYSKIGLNKELLSATKSAVSAREVDEYIATERSLYVLERAEQYTAFKLEYSNMDALQETRNKDTYVFYSQYAPMISAELTCAEIKTLARSELVQAIYYSPDANLRSDGDVSVPLIHADYTRDTLHCSGNGVKIGMIDVVGLPDTSTSYLENSNIIFDPNVDQQTFSDHATFVAAIMVAQSTEVGNKTYEGIVPDAELYATRAITDNQMRDKIEWLISQGVHVINMSISSDGSDSNTYGSYERWCDHVAIEHYVHFVKSAGNSNGNIGRPGMAYNILTVGAINDKNTPNEDDDIRYEILPKGSAYIEAEGLTNKPDLVAPGVDIAVAGGSGDGTSAAAPHVTAVVAQLCQRQPSLRTLQAGVKAILTASIPHSVHSYDCGIEDTDNYDKFGAGVVDAKASFDTANSNHMVVGNFPANGTSGVEKRYTFACSSLYRVRVSLTWLKHTGASSTHTNINTTEAPLADLDLYMIDPDGLWINCSSGYYNNTEIVDFTTTKSGTYQMVVIDHTPSTERVDFGLAWWIN